MFFNTKRNPRKTTRQKLITEQLEQKAMFSVSPVEPVVALDVGPVNQAGYEFQAKDVASVRTHCTGYCFADTDGFMKIGDIKGEGVRNPVAMFRSIPCFPEFFEVAEGEDGRMIVHAQYNVGLDGLAQANQQPSLTAIRDVDIASESVLGSASPGGDDIFMPKPNRTDVWTNGSATSLAPFTTGENGDSIVHPQYNVGEETLPTGTIISHEDSHLSAKDLIGQPPEPKIAPRAPHVSDRTAVIDGGSDSYTEVEWTYFASRQEVFARMGR